MIDATATFLIVTHAGCDLLRRFLDRYEDNDFQFIIFVDAKADDRPFRELASEFRNVEIFMERRPVYWCGYSFISAFLLLMERYLDRGLHSRYVFLLSGSCYPLLPPQEMRRRIADAPQHMVSFEGSINSIPRKRDFVRRYHFHDNAILSSRHQLTSVPLRVLRWALRPMARLLTQHLPERSIEYVKAGDVFLGSAWWGISNDTFVSLSDFLAERPEFLRGFHMTAVPEEFLVQTALVEAGIVPAEEIRSRSSDMIGRRVFGSHFIDWGTRSDSPRVLTESDAVDASSSGALFARKVILPESAEFVAAVDALGDRAYGGC